MGKLSGAAQSHELRAAACEKWRRGCEGGHPAVRKQSGCGGENLDVPERFVSNALRDQQGAQGSEAKDSGASGRPGDRFTGFSKKVTMNTRRVFLKNSALAIFGVGAIPSWLTRSRSEERRVGKECRS